MNRDEIMSMKPGRELDAMIAVKIMNYEISSADGHTSHNNLCIRNIMSGVGINYKKDTALNFNNINHNHPAPNYSTEIESAWEVEEKIDKLEFSVKTNYVWYLSNIVSNWKPTYIDNFNLIHASAADRCKAALLAVMVVE